jgi:hypothetical protein
LRCARRIFDAETISIARVIWVMFLTERMRRRISRVLGTIYLTVEQRTKNREQGD